MPTTQEEIDEYGQTKSTEILTAENAEDEGKQAAELHDETASDSTLSASIGERDGVRCRKYYSDGGHVEIAAELVHELDADGKQPRVVKLTDYTTEKVRVPCASPVGLRARWADAGQRADIIQQLAERGNAYERNWPGISQRETKSFFPTRGDKWSLFPWFLGGC